MRPVYYNVYDSGRRMGTYTATELQQMIHCSRQAPGECADIGRAFRGRYTFERIEDYGNMSQKELATEWDRLRMEIMRAAGR